MAFTVTPLTPAGVEPRLPPPGTQFQADGVNVGGEEPKHVNVTGALAGSYDPVTGTVTYEVEPPDVVEPPPESDLQVQYNDVNVGPPDTATLDFGGGLTVTDQGAGKRTVNVPSVVGLLTINQNDVLVADSVSLLDAGADALATAGSGGTVDIDFRSSVVKTGLDPSWDENLPPTGTNWSVVDNPVAVETNHWGTIQAADLLQWDATNSWFDPASGAFADVPWLVSVWMTNFFDGLFTFGGPVAIRAVSRLTTGGTNDATIEPVCQCQVRQQAPTAFEGSYTQSSTLGVWIPSPDRRLQFQVNNRGAEPMDSVSIGLYLRPLSFGAGRAVGMSSGPTHFVVAGGTADTTPTTLLWEKDFNVPIPSLGDYTLEDSFAVFSNVGGGLQLRTGVNGQTSFVWFHNCPVVSDFDLTWTERLEFTAGTDAAGAVAWRTATPGNGSEAAMTFVLKWGSLGGGFITLLYGGSTSNGWSGTTYVNTPAISAGTTYEFRLRVSGTSVKVWLNGLLILDSANTNAGAPSPIYFGHTQAGFGVLSTTFFIHAWLSTPL